MTPDQMEEFEESVQRTYNEDEPDEVLLSRQNARIEDLFDFDLASAEQSTIGVTLNPPVEPGLEFGVQRHVDFDLLQF